MVLVRERWGNRGRLGNKKEFYNASYEVTSLLDFDIYILQY